MYVQKYAGYISVVFSCLLGLVACSNNASEANLDSEQKGQAVHADNSHAHDTYIKPGVGVRLGNPNKIQKESLDPFVHRAEFLAFKNSGEMSVEIRHSEELSVSIQNSSDMSQVFDLNEVGAKAVNLSIQPLSYGKHYLTYSINVGGQSRVMSQVVEIRDPNNDEVESTSSALKPSIPQRNGVISMPAQETIGTK